MPRYTDQAGVIVDIPAELAARLGGYTAVEATGAANTGQAAERAALRDNMTAWLAAEDSYHADVTAWLDAEAAAASQLELVTVKSEPERAQKSQKG